MVAVLLSIVELDSMPVLLLLLTIPLDDDDSDCDCDCVLLSVPVVVLLLSPLPLPLLLLLSPVLLLDSGGPGSYAPNGMPMSLVPLNVK